MFRWFARTLLGIGALMALSGLCLKILTSKDPGGNMLFSGIAVIAITWFFSACSGDTGDCVCNGGAKPAEEKKD